MTASYTTREDLTRKRVNPPLPCRHRALREHRANRYGFTWNDELCEAVGRSNYWRQKHCGPPDLIYKGYNEVPYGILKCATGQGLFELEAGR